MQELVPELVRKRVLPAPGSQFDSRHCDGRSRPRLRAHARLQQLGRTVRMSLKTSPTRILARLERGLRSRRMSSRRMPRASPATTTSSRSTNRWTRPARTRPRRAAPSAVIRSSIASWPEGMDARVRHPPRKAEEGGVAVRYRIDGVLRQVIHCRGRGSAGRDVEDRWP